MRAAPQPALEHRDDHGTIEDAFARLRTLAQVQLDVELAQPLEVPVHQSIAARAAEMHDRGVRVSAIARSLGVDHHTVDKALRWFRSR